MEGRVTKEPAQRVVVRRKEHFFDLKLVYYTAIAICVVGLLYLHPPVGTRETVAVAGSHTARAKGPSWLKEVGHELSTRGLYNEALGAYDRYLSEASPPPSEAGNLCFQMGDICKDRLKQPGRAVAYYLKVRHHDPNSPSLDKVGLRVVACLDALGHGRQSQRELDRLTNVDRKQTGPRLSPIVAQAGSRDFTLADIDDAIAKLPEQLRPRFRGRAGKLQILREQLLAAHLLYEAGRRKGLHKQEDVLAKVHEFEKNLVATRVMQDRIGKLGQPKEAEVELFYKAEQKRYREPPQRRFTAWSFPSAAKAYIARDALKGGKSEVEGVEPRTFGPLHRSAGPPDVAEGGSITAAAFNVAVGGVGDPVKAGELFWIVRPDEELEGRQATFEEVKSRVAQDYAAFRSNQELQKLLDEQVKAQGVKIDALAIPDDEATR